MNLQRNARTRSTPPCFEMAFIPFGFVFGDAHLALHPQMAEVFRQKATTLAAGLEHDEQRDAARQALRGFLDRIVIPQRRPHGPTLNGLWTWRGLVTYYTVFVIDLASRRVQIVASTPYPDEAFMRQVGRPLTAADEGVLVGHRVLICDRDAKWNAPLRDRDGAAGIRVDQTPYQAPNANAYAKRFVRSIKHECLKRELLHEQVQEVRIHRIQRRPQGQPIPFCPSSCTINVRSVGSPRRGGPIIRIVIVEPERPGHPVALGLPPRPRRREVHLCLNAQTRVRDSRMLGCVGSWIASARVADMRCTRT